MGRRVHVWLPWSLLGTASAAIQNPIGVLLINDVEEGLPGALLAPVPAASILAGLSALLAGGHLRREVDLESLSHQLVDVVGQTPHPAHVSLWFRPTEDQT